MSRKLLLLLALFMLLFSAACSQELSAPSESPTPAEIVPTLEATFMPTENKPIETPTTPPGQVPEQFLPIIDDLAVSYGASPEDITVVAYEAVDWSDSCLGVQRPGIACLEVITPGYRIILETPNGQIEVHTNLEANVYRVLATESGIKGQALVGPACPGPARIGQECPDKPYQGIIQILDKNENPVAEINTAEDGTFQVDLPPGNYTLTVPDSNKFPIAAPQAVSVLPGQYSQVQFLLDSGIR
jgi:hypothetical protein